MKLLPLLILLFVTITTNAQTEGEIFSVYFDGSHLPAKSAATVINKKYYNHYSLVAKGEYDLRSTLGDDLVIDETGVFIEKMKLLSISRSQIREDAKYRVNKDNYLFGVVEDDSVLVFLEDELYYFLLPSKNYLYEVGNSKTKLYKGLKTNEYIILSQEDNGYYSAINMTFNNSTIALKELDLEQTVVDFKTLTNKRITVDDIPTYILQLSNKEWGEVMSQFVTYDNYALAVKG